jgi:hypothetical protein
MAIYSPIGVGYVHIPKTGGTSIRNWFLENIPKTVSYIPNHFRASVLCERHKDIDFLFATVRNPWSRAVSRWRHLKRRAEKIGIAKKKYTRRYKIFQNMTFKEYIDFQKKMTFEYFIDFYSEAINSKNNNRREEVLSNNPDIPASKTEINWRMLSPQITWLDRPINYIMKLENIDKDFKKIQDMFNCHIALPKNNQHNHGNKDDYKLFYNEHTKNKIAKIFEKDIETFKYRFEE